MNLRQLFKLPTYQPLNLIEISKGNLLYNYKVLSSINKKVKIAPVLKSNAYGHGIKEIAKILDSSSLDKLGTQNDRRGGTSFFCVDSIYEAYELLKANIKTPILIMGYIQPENLKVKKLPFSYAVSETTLAEGISKYQPHAGIHLFVDTGMNREGVPINDLPRFIETLKKFPNINIEGLMSHLASADDPKDPLNKIQFKNFQKAHDICKKNGIHPKYLHILNSDGLLYTLYTSDVVSNLRTVPHPMWNVVRAGLGLYGISNSHMSGGNTDLKPVLALKSKIIQIKKLKKRERVGYSGTFTAKKDITLGVLPLGYYDGVDRRLSNKGVVMADGVECPIIGLVSMNVSTVDLSNVSDPQIGQDVFVYSNNRKNKNSIENAAKICKTIPYELLIHLATSTKRVIV